MWQSLLGAMGLSGTASNQVQQTAIQTAQSQGNLYVQQAAQNQAALPAYSNGYNQHIQNQGSLYVRLSGLPPHPPTESAEWQEIKDMSPLMMAYRSLDYYRRTTEDRANPMQHYHHPDDILALEKTKAAMQTILNLMPIEDQVAIIAQKLSEE